MEKLTLKSYIDALPNERISRRVIFIKELAAVCNVNVTTVWRWINGKSKPNDSTKEIISKYTHIPSNQLFNEGN